MGWRDAPIVTDEPKWASAPLVNESRGPQPITSAASGFNRGVISLAGLPVDTALNAADLGIAAVGTGLSAMGRPDLAPDPLQRSSYIGSSDWISSQLAPTGIGSPVGGTMTDRLVYGTAAGASGGLLARSPSAVLPIVGRGLLGAGAASATAEATDDPATIAAAGLLGGGAPEIGSVTARGLLRGGKATREVMEKNLASFERAGVSPSLGQATEGFGTRAVESILSRFPGGAGLLAHRAGQQQTKLSDGLEGIAGRLAPPRSPTATGLLITKGIEGPGGFIENFRAKQSRLYAKVDKFIPANTMVDSANTRTALSSLNADIPNAPTLSQSFKNPKIQGIEEALKADATGGKLPYEALKKLRTLVGEQLTDNSLVADVPRAKWKQLYSALSSDLEAAAKTAGRDAETAYRRANDYTRAGHERIDVLDSVIGKVGGPEKVYQAVLSGTDAGATVLRKVTQSLPTEAKKALSASVIRRMGRATNSNQNDDGDAFSSQTFLTQWNKLSPDAKRVMFDGYGPEFRKDMDAVARVASNLRDGSKVYANPSGTAGAAAGIGLLSSMGTAAATGNYALAAKLTAAAMTANGAARFLTNPSIVKWLARATETSDATLPAQMANLAAIAERTGDPEVEELQAELTKRFGSGRQSLLRN